MWLLEFARFWYHSLYSCHVGASALPQQPRPSAFLKVTSCPLTIIPPQPYNTAIAPMSSSHVYFGGDPLVKLFHIFPRNPVVGFISLKDWRLASAAASLLFLFWVIRPEKSVPSVEPRLALLSLLPPMLLAGVETVPVPPLTADIL